MNFSGKKDLKLLKYALEGALKSSTEIAVQKSSRKLESTSHFLVSTYTFLSISVLHVLSLFYIC